MAREIRSISQRHARSQAERTHRALSITAGPAVRQLEWRTMPGDFDDQQSFGSNYLQ